MNHDHDWQIARQKGRYVRYQCATCLLWDRDWHHDGKNIVVADALLDSKPAHDYGPLGELTVTELRKVAKDNGIVGVSKYRKAELLSLMEGTVSV